VSDILKESRQNWKVKVSNTVDNAGITQSNAGTKQLVHQEISKQLCHLSSMLVVNALFDPVFQCASRYTATRLIIII